MKLTVKKLENLNACKDAIEEFKNQKERNVFKVFDLLLKDKKYQWANWLITQLLERQNRIRYAIHAAEQCLDKFEEKYPEDKRPKLAIEAAKKVLEKDNKKNRDAAYAAAHAAVNAAYAAVNAAYAAAHAAVNAAYAASAAYAVNAAAYAAASAAADVAVDYIKIIKYGITLLKKQELAKLKGRKNEN